MMSPSLDVVIEQAHPGQSVLIVDGDRSVADALGRGLEQQGYYPLMARTGKSAIEMAKSCQPQLIVMDQRLPDMDGVSLCEELSRVAETWSIPAIVLSNMSRPDIIRRSKVRGAQYFVRKPYDATALFFLIQHAIEESLHAVVA